MERRKTFIRRILAVIITVGGLCCAIYPFLSNYFYDKQNVSYVQGYSEAVEQMDETQGDEILQAAYDYNQRLINAGVTLTDPFTQADKEESLSDYASTLCVDGTSLMGYLNIPCIDVELPIFHGTDADTLEQGVGHLEGSSLPVGGSSTHAVLTGHSGLSNKTIFTDLTNVQTGDMFYIHVLNETLAYQVDQIQVVLPSETDALKIIPDGDYVTLVTCTPYGVNTHRLLVRGTRVPYEEGGEGEAVETKKSLWMNEYQKAVLIGLLIAAGILLILVLVKLVKSFRKPKKNVESQSTDKSSIESTAPIPDDAPPADEPNDKPKADQKQDGDQP